MFGERYFATRKRLTDVVLGVNHLGWECGAEVPAIAPSRGFLKSLEKPFLAIVCGEVNSGKSALINGLFGEELCEVNALPHTKKILWYQYADESQAVETGPMLEERHLPQSFLKDFQVIDTPGSNSTLADHLPVIEHFLPVADLLFFVFPVSNPWGAATWQLVARLPEAQLPNAAFILQQCDLKEESDLEVILGHMRTLAEQKTGQTPPIFPVSAKWAIEAKAAGPSANRLLRKSGFPALESFISSRVNQNPVRRRDLKRIQEATEAALHTIEDRIEERTDTLDSDQRFLAELENEVDVRREGQAKALAERLTDLGEVFMGQGQGATYNLSRRTSILQSFISLFQQEKLPAEIEKNLTEAVKEAVEEQAGKDGVELVQNCRNHWETVEPRIRENLAVSPPDFDEETESLAGTRERFVRRLGRSAKHAVAHLKIRSTLELQMEIRRMALRRYMIAFLTLLTLAGVLGGLGLHPWPWVAVSASFLLLGIAAFHSKRSRKSLCKDFMERIEDLRQPFADSLSDDYKDGVREFYLEYGGLFEIVRRRIADQKLLLKPQMERWNNLFLELKAIEQEL